VPFLAPSRSDRKGWVRGVRWLEPVGALEVETAGGIDTWEIAPDLEKARAALYFPFPEENRSEAQTSDPDFRPFSTTTSSRRVA